MAIPLSLFLVPHVIVCLLGARKLHCGYLKNKNENVRDFEVVYGVLGLYFFLTTILSTAIIPPIAAKPIGGFTDALLTIPILFFFRIVLRILEKPLLSKIIQLFSIGFFAGEVALLVFAPITPVLGEISPFYYWRHSYTYNELTPFMLFDVVRTVGGVAVMALFFWIGRVSAGVLRKRYLFIASGFMLLPVGLGVSIGLAIFLPASLVWIPFLLGASFALVGLLFSLAGVYSKIPT